MYIVFLDILDLTLVMNPLCSLQEQRANSPQEFGIETRIYHHFTKLHIEGHLELYFMYVYIRSVFAWTHAVQSFASC